MDLLSQLTIPRDNKDAVIQLLKGDLTAIPREHAADILVISAYPKSYGTQDKNTLMAALHAKNIIVEDLAKDKAIDLSDNLNCWLSKALTPAQQEQLNFKRILCFEPPYGEAKEKVVANIFRCINTFAYEKQNNIIAMPVLASGNQKEPIEKMLPAILDAAIFWLERGLPLDCIKLVLRNEKQVEAALPLFIKARQQYALKNNAQKGTISAIEAWQLFEFKNNTQSPGAATMVIVESEIKELAEKESRKTSSAAPNIITEEEKQARSSDFPVPAPAFAEPDYPIPQSSGAANDDAGSEETVEPPPAVTPPPPAVTPPQATTTEPPVPVEKKEFDFFISYSHKQTDAVKLFVDALLQKNPQLNIFYDRSSIPAGGLWIKLISDAIQNARSVICVLSPQYTASDVCWDEFQCAKAKEYRTKKPVIKTINFYNDANLPLMMSIYSYIDCTEGDIDKLKNCVADIIQ